MAPEQNAESKIQRGTKRKRPVGKTVKAPPPKREIPVEELLSKKLHHGLQEVRKAAKKAAAFELRKLVKRLKAARGEKPAKANVKADDTTELEHQLEVLKHIDHEPFANTAFKTKILKDKLLSTHEAIKAATEKLSENLVQPSEHGCPAAKVHSRLLSSKTIADAVHAVVISLKEILDPSLAAAKAKVKAAETEDEESEDEGEDDDDEINARQTKGKKVRLAAPDGSDEQGASGSEAEVDETGWESGTVDGDEDGAGWESGSVDNDRDVSSDSEEVEEWDSVGEEDSGETVASASTLATAAKALATAKAKAKAKVKLPANEPKDTPKAGESTFLPSLSVGFTRGDSSASDFSDIDAEADAADAPRKNRRGQRARRMIWEKKYGRNANHVKSQQEQQQHDQRQHQGRGPNGKGSGRDWAKPGARPSRGRGGAQGERFGSGHPPPPVDAGWPKSQAGAGPGAGRGAGASASASGTGEGKLHPSWEAKKRLKERLNPSIVPGQGKKIKF
ncbi:Bud-site selection protein [Trametes gibbosa]|nr:Bud-site selection protein [Trametes gibbosa]